MPRRQPVRPIAAAAAALSVVGVLATGCGAGSDRVVNTIALDPDQGERCRAFVASLPDFIDGQPARALGPSGDRGRAYSDPAITVTCGVATPADYSIGASCEQARGVGWYVPDEDYADPDDGSAPPDATLTAVGYRPRVEVFVPSRYRPSGPFNAIGALAADVRRHLVQVQQCS